MIAQKSATQNSKCMNFPFLCANVPEWSKGVDSSSKLLEANVYREMPGFEPQRLQYDCHFFGI